MTHHPFALAATSTAYTATAIGGWVVGVAADTIINNALGVTGIGVGVLVGWRVLREVVSTRDDVRTDTIEDLREIVKDLRAQLDSEKDDRSGS